MKQKTIYKCDYCKKTRYTVEAMERHEKECVHNPKSVNCYRCAHSYKDNYYDDISTIIGAPMCNYTEDIIDERRADKCSEFVRSDTTFEARKYEDALAEEDDDE